MRLRYDALTGTLAAGIGPATATLTFTAPLTHDAGNPVPTISGNDFIPLSLIMPNGVLAEIVHITVYTQGQVSATVSRGQEGTAGVTLPSGTRIVSAPTAQEFPDIMFTVYEFGAQGGLANDTTAIINAMDAAANEGGGGVLLMPGELHGWDGPLTIPDGVYLVSNATRQPSSAPDTDPPVCPGLVALDASCVLNIGDWDNPDATKPGGVRNLNIDGNNIGGDGAELVRIAGVDVQIASLFVIRSAGDGIVFDATQNSTIIGGHSTRHVGAALALDNGAGALSFHGGYYGGYADRALMLRDTSGEPDLYPFGPVQNNWFGTIFEQYDRGLTEAACIEIRCGQDNAFWGVNVTHGADTDAEACILVSNDDAAALTSVAFNNLLWGPGGNALDALRVVGAQYVTLEGLNSLSAGNEEHFGVTGDLAGRFICQDTDSARLDINGRLFSYQLDALELPYTRAINGGTYALWHSFDPRFPGYRRTPFAGFVATPGEDVEFDAALYDRFLVVGAANTNIGDLTVINAEDNMVIVVGIQLNGTGTLGSWPPDFTFTNNNPPGFIDGEYTYVTMYYWDGEWREQGTRPEEAVWVAPALGAGIANLGGGYAAAGYYKDAAGIVRLQGTMTGAGGTPTLFTLPAGFRPAANKIWDITTDTGAGRVDVMSNGNVIRQAGGNGFYSIDPIQFPAEA